MLDDYSRTGGPSDFDTRGNGPPMKRPRHDALNDGHWANAQQIDEAIIFINHSSSTHIGTES